MKTKKEILKYWEQPTDGSNEPRGYFDPIDRSIYLYKKLSKYVNKYDSILEVGCNVGRNLHFLYKAGYENLTGIEINTRAVRLLEEIYTDMKDIKIINSPVEDCIKQIPHKDVIFSMAVLMHIHPESEWIFKEITDKVDGYLITIEDETVKQSWRQWERDYKFIFERLGLMQVKEYIPKPEIFGSGYVCRIFKRRQYRNQSTKKYRVFVCDKRDLVFKLKKEITILPKDKRKQADFYLIWIDYNDEATTYASEAIFNKIPIIQIQHGLNSVKDYGNPINKTLKSDYICVWSKSDYDFLIENGIRKKRIMLTGCPFLEDMRLKRKRKVYDVLFTPIHWIPEAEENFIILKKLLKTRYRVMTKIIYLNDADRFYELTDDVYHTDPRHGNHIIQTINILKRSKVIVSINEGTPQLIAHCLQIPCICITGVWKQKKLGNGKYIQGKEKAYFKYSEAVYKTDLKGLDDMIKRVLKNHYKKDIQIDVAKRIGGYGLNFSEEFIDQVRDRI